MTDKEIRDIIDRDVQAINDSPFPEPLPDWLLANFDDVIMGERQNVNPYTAEVLISVLSKKDDPSKLTVAEGGWVLNVLNAVAPYLIAKDIDEYIEKKSIFGPIMHRYNMGVQRELKKLEVKEATLRKNNRKMIVT